MLLLKINYSMHSENARGGIKAGDVDEAIKFVESSDIQELGSV